MFELMKGVDVVDNIILEKPLYDAGCVTVYFFLKNTDCI